MGNCASANPLKYKLTTANKAEPKAANETSAPVRAARIPFRLSKDSGSRPKAIKASGPAAASAAVIV